MKWFARWIALGLLAAALLAGREYVVGVAGPRPGPTDLSRLEGRELLGLIFEAQGAAAWRDRSPVRFDATVEGGRSSGRRFRWALDPVSRSADVEILGGAGGRFRFDAAAGRVEPQAGLRLDPRARRALDTIAPSIGFWCLVPAALNDTTAEVWRLPDGRDDAAESTARLAVRWPASRDWFLFDADPMTGRLIGVAFVDARFTPLVRWYGRYEGPGIIDGRPMPRSWRFRAAAGWLRALTGGRDLIVLRFEPAPAPPGR